MDPLEIREKFIAFQQSRILLTAFELGVFTALDKKPLMSADIAEALQCDLRATDRLLNAVCTTGLLEKKEGKYYNTEASSRFLVKGKPGYMAGLHHTVHIWDSWSYMTSAVRDRKTRFEGPVNDRSDSWLEAFIAAMHHRALRQAPESVAGLDLSRVINVLDVGGGSGIFSMAFIRQKSGINATVFDLPNVVNLTEEYIRKEGFAGQITTAAGDYLKDPLPEGFDIVFLSAVIHSNSYTENEALISKCAGSLNPGGRVIVQDFVMEECRTKPAYGAIFAMNMLVATPSGDTYTEEEVKTWMKKAGLSDFMRIDQNFGTSQIIGRKPE